MTFQNFSIQDFALVMSLFAIVAVLVIAIISVLTNRNNVEKWMSLIKEINSNKPLLDVQEVVGEKIPDPVKSIIQQLLEVWETLTPEQHRTLPQEWQKWFKAITDGLPNMPSEGGNG